MTFAAGRTPLQGPQTLAGLLDGPKAHGPTGQDGNGVILLRLIRVS
jgi:hypothetical protein